jgi:hypothetical protein
MGKIPIVLKMAMQINHTRWLFLADFQKASIFHTASHIAKQVMTIIIRLKFDGSKHFIFFKFKG